MRFVLAFWVVLHHLTGSGQMLEAWSRSLPVELYTIIRGGYLAVGTFFVLSGFVLARSYASPAWSQRGLVRYAAGRIARVYPVYLLSLLVVSPFIVYETIFKAGTPALIANYILVLQGWTGRLPVNWNTPAWSLSCELFFYLLFPVAVIPFRKATWPRVIVAALFACALTIVLRRYGVPDSWKPIMHFSDFLMGIATASAFDLLSRRKWLDRRGYWLYLPAAGLSGALIAHPEVLQAPITLNTALRPLNAILLIGLAFGGGALARLFSTSPVVFLGKASYSMYILHIPILWWYGCVRAERVLPGIASGIVFSALVIAISSIVFHYVEEPYNQRLRRWITDRISNRLAPARVDRHGQFVVSDVREA